MRRVDPNCGVVMLLCSVRVRVAWRMVACFVGWLGVMPWIPGAAWGAEEGAENAPVSFVGDGADAGLEAPVAVGDLDGDGLVDHALAASRADPGGVTDAGRVYLFLGDVSNRGVGRPLSEVADVVIDGVEAGGRLGSLHGVGGGGDLNGDGLDDLVLAAPGTGGGQGTVYIVLGRRSGWDTVSLDAADGVLSASVRSNLGEGGVVIPGDLDGDGYGDLLVAAHTASGAGFLGVEAGLVHVFYGTGDWSERTLETADAVIKGDGRYDAFGASVVAAGDLNGDGRPDFAVGAPGRDMAGTDAGAVYFFAGGERLEGTVAAGVAALTQLQGDQAGDGLGTALAAGDATEDGLTDVLVAAISSDATDENAGQVYLVPGRIGAWPASTTHIGDYAFLSFTGIGSQDRLGTGVGPLSDIDGDGHLDFVVGAPDSDLGAIDAGEIAIFLGPASRWSMATSVDSADLRVTGEAISDGLSLVASLGPGTALNGAGRTLLACAPYHDANGIDSGKVYLLPVAAWLDADNDEFSPADGDCDDTDATVYPGAEEVCDGLDNDCNGVLDDGLSVLPFYPDADGDGYGAGDPLEACAAPPGFAASSGDCDDEDPRTYPGAEEACDGLDNDCDGIVPEEEQDQDGDGFVACISGEVGDCDDTDPRSYPGAEEVCDGLDNDCDGLVPDGEQDQDGDGYLACDPEQADCDDTDPAAHPGAEEVCDGLDNDCDGRLDPEEVDDDLDGVLLCAGDCDDLEPATYPGAEEVCDGLDNDCDGTPGADEQDQDGDGFAACSLNGLPADCAPLDPMVYPGAEEVCDGIDTDCNGIPGPGELDTDQDGVLQCAGDCDDADATVHPGADEVCDEQDNDCDGEVDEDLDTFVYYPDQDGDGYGVTEEAIEACALPPDHALVGGDCDDTDRTIHPGAEEDPVDGLDNDCDGDIDEGAVAETPTETPVPPGDDDTAVPGDDDTVNPSEPTPEPTPEATPEPSTGNQAGDTVAEEDSGGCNCRVGTPGGATSGLPGLLALAFIYFRRRPRQHGERPDRR